MLCLNRFPMILYIQIHHCVLCGDCLCLQYSSKSDTTAILIISITNLLKNCQFFLCMFHHIVDDIFNHLLCKRSYHPPRSTNAISGSIIQFCSCLVVLGNLLPKVGQMYKYYGMPVQTSLHKLPMTVKPDCLAEEILFIINFFLLLQSC